MSRMASARTRHDANAAASAALLAEFEGELAGKYEMQALIGSGGMGKVVRALHRQLNQLVAIKFLHADLIRDDFVPRFLREARSAAKIASPHVTRVLDVGVSTGGMPFIVMEHLEGEDLGRWVATRGPMPQEQAVSCILQVLHVISEAHAKGIVHRDLKPGNLFATEGARGELCIKVLDFGLAKRMSGVDTFDAGMTEPGTLVGSPSYMSPEQFLDAQDVDERSDIWAIGASLYELISGAPPFRGANLPQLYAAVVHGPIRCLKAAVPEVPDELDAVVSRCLCRNREGRFESAEELAAALAPFVESARNGPLGSNARVSTSAVRPRSSSQTAGATVATEPDLQGFTTLESGVDVPHAPPSQAPSEPAPAAAVLQSSRRGLEERGLLQPLGPRTVGLGLLALAVITAAWLVLSATTSPSPQPMAPGRRGRVTATATEPTPPVPPTIAPSTPMLDPAASPDDPGTSQKPIVRVATAPSARKTTAASGAAQPAAPAAKASSSIYEKYP